MVQLQIQLYQRNGKSFTLEVPTDITIAEIKGMISKQQNGLPINMLQLYYGSTTLNDYKTLKDYRILNTARISAYLLAKSNFQLRIILENQKEIQIEVDPSQSVLEVKKSICEYLGYNQSESYQMDIIYCGRRFADSNCIDHYGIKNNAQVYLSRIKNTVNTFPNQLHTTKNQINYQSSYLRKSFADVQRNMSMKHLNYQRERESQVLYKLPLLRSNSEVASQITRRNLGSLILK